MTYTTAGLLAVGLLCLVDLALTIALMRRRPAPAGAVRDFHRQGVLPIGATVGAFAATAVDGFPAGDDTFGDPTLVALLLPGCGPCESLLPRFVELARRHPGGRDRVLAVLVSGGPDDVAGYADRLREVARVVVDEDGRQVAPAFAATGFPVLYLVDREGRVLAGGGGDDAVAQLEAAGGVHV